MTLRIEIPRRWRREGLALRGEAGGVGAMVVGDPCIVRDEEAGLWRMFLFALPPGHAHAVCEGDPFGGGTWRLCGPLEFTNPGAASEVTVFKPFVIVDAGSSGVAARIGGRYALLLVTDHHAKVVRRAWSDRLAGPWTIEDGILIDRGSGDDFDAKHVDAVSAFHFRERDEILYFYMGYPLRAQRHSTSPLGSAQAAAVEPVAAAVARADATLRVAGSTSAAMRLAAPRKLGPVLPPSETRGHWASGWVGGLQLVPGRSHRWYGLVNASPTAPRDDDTQISREEPPPSLGGFAFCDQEFPVSGWRWCDEPIEWIGDLPDQARQTGEAVNFWRHYALVGDDGRIALFYNSGDYFDEKLFRKTGA